MKNLEDMDYIEILDCLAHGINPNTKERIEKDSILRHPDVITALFEGVIALGDKYKKEKKKRYFVFYPYMDEQIDRTEPSISIKPFAENIAKVTGLSSNKIQNKILDFLIGNEILVKRQDPEDNYKIKKFATDKGIEIGITNGKYSSNNGKEYHCVYYSVQAQEYVISHLSDILDSCEI